MTFTRRHIIQSAGASALLATLGQHALAQNQPELLRIITGFAAGGTSDTICRRCATQLAPGYAKTAVVENRTGAGGQIAIQFVKSAAPDGTTMLQTPTSMLTIYPHIYKKLAYDPVESFVPVGPAGSAPMLLLARADLPANTLPEFIAWLGKSRDKASYGSAGVGSISHYGCVMLLSSIKQNATHVPYKGVAPAMNDLMGGQTDFMCDQTTTALPQVAGGRIKAIAVLSKERLASLPRTGTAAEAGYPLDVRSWNALFAPRGTPAPVLATLTQALQNAVGDAGLIRQLQGVGVELPKPADTTSVAIAQRIAIGLRDDVPALKAKGEYLD